MRQEIKIKYEKFRRDNFLFALVLFVVTLIIGYAQKPEYRYVFTVAAFAFLLIGLLVVFLPKEVFKISFDETEKKITILYSRFSLERIVSIDYETFHYSMKKEYMGRRIKTGLVLRLYNGKHQLFKIDPKNYGWSEGLIIETNREFKVRNLKNEQ